MKYENADAFAPAFFTVLLLPRLLFFRLPEHENLPAFS